MNQRVKTPNLRKSMMKRLCQLLSIFLLASCTMTMKRAPIMPEEIQNLLLQPYELQGKTLNYDWASKDGCNIGAVRGESNDGEINVSHFIWICINEEFAKQIYSNHANSTTTQKDIFTSYYLGNRPEFAVDFDARCIVLEYHFGDQNLDCATLTRYKNVVSQISILTVNGKNYTPTMNDLIKFTKERDSGFAKYVGQSK